LFPAGLGCRASVREP